MSASSDPVSNLAGAASGVSSSKLCDILADFTRQRQETNTALELVRNLPSVDQAYKDGLSDPVFAKAEAELMKHLFPKRNYP